MAFSSSCKRRAARTTLAALLCLPSLFSQGSAILNVSPPQKLVGKRNNAVQAKINLSLQPGYHVNSNTPNEAYLIPLRLTWETNAALQAPEVIFPKPLLEKYEFSDKPVSVFTGEFDVNTKFKVPASAPTGPGVLIGKLRYQACTKKACFPPKTVEVRLPYQIQ